MADRRIISIDTASNLESIATPLLTFYSPRDTIIDATAVPTTFERFGSPDKLLVAVTDAGDPDQHVLAGDILSPGTTSSIADTIVSFLRRL